MLDSATDAAFLRAILAAPDDDAPRLVYADWLDEQDDADRAEFIRLQIHLNRLVPGEAEWGPAYTRSHELELAHHVSWVNRLPQFEEVHWRIFSRGFISAAQFDSADAYFQNAKAVFSAAPVQELRLHRFNWPEATRLGESKHLRRVRVLDFVDGNSVGNQGVEGLMKSRFLVDLTSLKLSQNAFGPAGVRAIAMASYMRSLRELKLDRNELYDDAMRFLAASPNFAHLETLDMDRTRTGDEGVKALASAKTIRRLMKLHLSNNLISDAGLTALVQSDVVAEVKTLFLNGNSIGDGGIRALTESDKTGQIDRLHLRRNQFGDEAAFALARWQRDRPLSELLVGENRISDLAAAELRSRWGKAVNVY
jgi:uncharacterized protein (TIGR02996 family)